MGVEQHDRYVKHVKNGEEKNIIVNMVTEILIMGDGGKNRYQSLK